MPQLFTITILLLLSSIPLVCSSRKRAGLNSKANDWYQHQPMLVGSNYLPASAINELEMWQAETFDPAQIDKEFGWAESLGMNTMRVFLHDLLWQQDSAGFKKRIDQFLEIASRTTSGRFSFCSIPAGTRIRSWARSIRPFPACTIPDGCRVRVRWL